MIAECKHCQSARPRTNTDSATVPGERGVGAVGMAFTSWSQGDGVPSDFEWLRQRKSLLPFVCIRKCVRSGRAAAV